MRSSSSNYAAQATDHMLCLDVSSGKIGRSATKMAGVKEWNTKGFHSTIYGVSVKVLQLSSLSSLTPLSLPSLTLMSLALQFVLFANIAL